MRIFGKKGFTLLELLVVISIIGILVAIGAVAYSNAQRKARDAKRVGDMKGIQNTFEQYYAVNNSQYATACSTMWSGMPTDPKPGWTAYSTGGSSCTLNSYCVCALLESGSGGNNSGTTCPVSGSGSYFCVSNLQ